MREKLLWDRPMYRPKDRCADVPEVGRYFIHKEPRREKWALYLNMLLLGTFNSAEEAVGAAERDAYRMLHMKD
jgi:hypothetical protein